VALYILTCEYLERITKMMSTQTGNKHSVTFVNDIVTVSMQMSRENKMRLKCDSLWSGNKTLLKFYNVQ